MNDRVLNRFLLSLLLIGFGCLLLSLGVHGI